MTADRYKPHDDWKALWTIADYLRQLVDKPVGSGGGGATIWGQIAGTLSNQADLQSALNSKSAVGHNHDSAYDPLGAADLRVAAHEMEGDPHSQYLTPAEGDAAYDLIGTAAAAVAAHESEGDPHAQYLTNSEADALYDGIGDATAAVAAHNAQSDPHPQYLTPAEGGALYDSLGAGSSAAASAVAAHAAAPDPHPGYLTPSEGNAAYQPLDSDLTTLASSITAVGHAIVAAATTAAQRTAIGLGSVDNTSDTAKPVSTAQQTALDGKAALAHSHAEADVTGLTSDLAGKAPTVHAHAQSDVTGLASSLAGKSDTVHAHAQTDVTGLAASLAGKSDTVHSHAQSDVTGLAASLAAKADLVHSHAISEITGLQAALDARPRSVANASVTTAGPGFAADTYLAGSACAIPSAALKATAKYRCRFSVSKTGAGVATPIINVRIGTLGTTGDASRGILTFAAQTAVIDEGMFEIEAIFRTVGSGTTAVLQSCGRLTHRLSVTGLSVDVSGMKLVTSAGFDSTVANSIIGLSVNGGTSAAWTIAVVSAELVNLL